MTHTGTCCGPSRQALNDASGLAKLPAVHDASAAHARELCSYLEQAVVLSDEGILDVFASPTRADRLDPDSGPFVPLEADQRIAAE